MALRTRKPTGQVSWPFILLAGAEKSGKSYAAATFSASDMIGRTFWIEVGESDADMYAVLPGARYEIVEHDGTMQSILQAVKDASAEPPTNGKPNCIVLDSITNVWDMLVSEQEAVTLRRGKTSMTVDQWNVAKRQWRKLVSALNAHVGPVLATARLEQVTVMSNGKPTPDKTWKIRAEKSLPFEVTGTVEMRAPGEAYITGLRSLKVKAAQGQLVPIPNFTVERLMHGLGIDGGGRRITPAVEQPEQYPDPTDTNTILPKEQQ
ncbi:ATP-binding protein [Actinomyces bowdenii]|uniref:ATP-binding protein n=1 Tax=Actinomyces bowdenii TaxID=131109 RepID=UPI00214C2D1D|nr:ATP-binding protein [Actinomyces bowdenii]MCR2051473.1 ATP-binding protein [Actinomyces bowdenii]